MSLVFSEEFETATGAPPGNDWEAVGVGIGNVVAGGYRGNCYEFGSEIRHMLGTGSTYSATYTSLTLFFAVNPTYSSIVGGGFAPIYLNLGCHVGTDANSICSLHMSNSSQLFMLNGVAVVGAADEPTEVITDGTTNVWQYIQVNVTVSTATVGGNPGLLVTGTVAVPGRTLFTGSAARATTLPPFFDYMHFSGVNPGGHSNLDSIYCYSPAVAINAFPNAGTGTDVPKAHISQAAVELAQQPDDSAARVSQAAIEWAQAPDDSAVRVSQAIIELVLAPGPGWRTYEA